MNNELISALENRITVLEQELNKLKKIKLELEAGRNSYSPERPKKIISKPPPIIEGSIKEQVLKILSDEDRPMKALEILSQLKNAGFEIVRTSLSPQLSRLKQEGRLLYRDKEWSLTTAGIEEVRKMALPLLRK